MTDAASAIIQVARLNHPNRPHLLEQFYEQWQDEPLVLDKWLRAQAIVPGADTVHRVRELTEHAAFDASNPNKVYALILGFTHGNAVGFHNVDGSGYSFLEDWVRRLDPINPQVSARLASALNSWRKYTPELRTMMKSTLASILSSPALSSDVREIISKNLESASS